MNTNCYDTCELATSEYIDSAIMERWNETKNIDEFVNSFAPHEVVAIACNLSHRNDSEFFTSFDDNVLDVTIVLSDYIRSWMVDNLKYGCIDGIGELFCLLYDIREFYHEHCAHCMTA